MITVLLTLGFNLSFCMQITAKKQKELLLLIDLEILKKY